MSEFRTHLLKQIRYTFIFDLVNWEATLRNTLADMQKVETLPPADPVSCQFGRLKLLSRIYKFPVIF